MLILMALACAHAQEQPAQYRFIVPQGVPVVEVQPATEGAWLGAGKDVGGNFGVRIELEVSRRGGPFRTVPLSTPVCNDDFVALTVTPSEGGFIHIMNFGTSGRWNRVFPSDGMPNDFRPDRPARFPPQAGYGFPITGAAGTESLMLFLSSGPFSKELAQLEDRLAGREGAAASVPAEVTGGGSRAVSVGVLRDVGLAMAAYYVGGQEQTLVIELDHQASCGDLP